MTNANLSILLLKLRYSTVQIMVQSYRSPTVPHLNLYAEDTNTQSVWTPHVSLPEFWARQRPDAEETVHKTFRSKHIRSSECDCAAPTPLNGTRAALGHHSPPGWWTGLVTHLKTPTIKKTTFIGHKLWGTWPYVRSLSCSCFLADLIFTANLDLSSLTDLQFWAQCLTLMICTAMSCHRLLQAREPALQTNHSLLKRWTQFILLLNL